MIDCRRRRGQATVEVVLALPVVVLVLLLVVQVALVAGAQVLVVQAAREGARAASVDGTVEAARAAVRSSPGLGRGDTTIDVDLPRLAGAMVRVEVRYRVPTDVPLVGPLLGDPELSASVAMRREGVTPGPDQRGG